MVPMSRTLTRYYGYVDTICEQTIRLSEFAFEDLPLSTFYISDVPVSLKWFCEQFITALGRGRAWRIPSALIRSMGAVGEIANNIQLSFPINRLQANEMTRSYPVPLAPTLAITRAKTDYRSASESVIAWALSDPNFVRRIRG
jgi:hypothetical protein